MPRIESFSDLRQVVDSWMESMDQSYYISFDTMLNDLTEDVLNYIRNEFNFHCGDDMPEIESKYFYEVLCSKYEI
jgi:hypothetical protein